MDYLIISRSTSAELEEKITSFLKKGYTLAGGVAFDNENKKFLQAVYMRL